MDKQTKKQPEGRGRPPATIRSILLGAVQRMASDAESGLRIRRTSAATDSELIELRRALERVAEIGRATQLQILALYHDADAGSVRRPTFTGVVSSNLFLGLGFRLRDAAGVLADALAARLAALPRRR